MQCSKQLLQLCLCQHQVLLAAQLDVEKWKRVSTTNKQVGNEHKNKEEAGQPAPRDKLLEDGWSVKLEHTLAVREGVFITNMKEAKMLMAGNALQRVLASACSR